MSFLFLSFITMMMFGGEWMGSSFTSNRLPSLGCLPFDGQPNFQLDWVWVMRQKRTFPVPDA